MSIGLPDIKLLWGRAGGLCSICKITLSEDKKTSNDKFPFGHQAHIVAEEEDGPRGKSPLTLEQRNTYHNLILLCPNCHTKIDKAPDEYPVEVLHQLKSQHELWFEKSRVTVADKLKQANDYVYVKTVDAAVKLCMLEEWEAWTSHPLSTSPSWKGEWMCNVEEFRQRVIRAILPGTNPELEEALDTLSINLIMAVKVFSKHCEPKENGWFVEVRFYRSSHYYDTYDVRLEEYWRWIGEQDAYIHEATMSANWMADVVQRTLDPMFFAVPGKFVITSGPNMSLQFVTRVLEYSEEGKKTAHKRALEALKRDQDQQRQIEKEMSGE
jgi:hypothetical protein